MCGIAGILHPSKAAPLELGRLRAMTGAMVHRGPDSDGHWLSDDQRVGLGHRRLAIVDLSPAGAQPMHTPDGDISVTFNGEIYNYPELRRTLQGQGISLRSQSDTEVILHLYRLYGDEVVRHLDGDFAFALWDRPKRRMLLARDPAGLKPLYHTRLPGGGLAFASELKALLALPNVSNALNMDAFSRYLTFLVTPAPETLINGISKLPAGHRMSVLQDESLLDVRIEQYWEPLPRKRTDNARDLDEELADLFDQSVKKRLMADVPVGVLFSGGVDSTLNASSFLKAANRTVRTYTVGVKDKTDAFDDEAANARAMAQRLGTDHREIAIGIDDLLATAKDLAHQQDEPLADPVTVPLYFITKLAREDGTIVLHAGEGADELFCGYSKYLRFMEFQRKWWRMLQTVPGPLTSVSARMLGMVRHPMAEKVADVFDRRSNNQEFFLSSSIAFYDRERNFILAPEARARLASNSAFTAVAPFYDRLRDLAPDAGILETITYIELQLRLPELLLMRLDKMSMKNSIEVRAPFLDRRLMEFALSVPESFKLRDGVPKEPIKRLAARHVPRDLLYKPKRGFGAPIVDWFRGELGKRLADLVDDHHRSSEVLFDRNEIHRRLRVGPRTTNEAFQLWVVYNFLMWRSSTMQAAATPERAIA